MMTYNDDIPDFLKAMIQSEADPKEKVDKNKPTFDRGKRSRYKAATGFTSRKYRGKIFEDTAMDMIPDRKWLMAYENMVGKAYAKALQEQLRIRARVRDSKGNSHRYSSIGYATGNLQRSITAEAKTILTHLPKQGRVYIEHEIKPEYLLYGDYIAGGRMASYIPIAPLVKWIEAKMSLGSFRGLSGDQVENKRKQLGLIKGKKWKENRVKSIAFAISKAAAKKPKPPVIRDWSSWTNNTKLQQRFREYIREDSPRYLRNIRRSIARNISKQYGKTK